MDDRVLIGAMSRHQINVELDDLIPAAAKRKRSKCPGGRGRSHPLC